MPSPHGVFCGSPHGAFIQSPHGVRGCAQVAGHPMYIAVSWTGLQAGVYLIDIGGGQTFPFLLAVPYYDTRTRVYRIDNGAVTWASTRPDQAPSNPGGDLSYEPRYASAYRFDVNAHGVFLARRQRVEERTNVTLGTDVHGDPVVSPHEYISHLRNEKIDADTGEVLATQDSETEIANFIRTHPPHMICANLQHIFLFSGLHENLSHLPDHIQWARHDGDLNEIETGTYSGPWQDTPPTTSIDFGGFPKPIITREGNPRHHALVFKRGDMSLLEIKPGTQRQGSGVIAIDDSSNVIYGGLSGGTKRYVVDTTGVHYGVTLAVRGPSPLGSELLGFLTATGGTLYGRSVNAQVGDNGVNFNPTWSLDIAATLKAFVATQARPPIPADAVFTGFNVCHDGGTEQRIRITGLLKVVDPDTNIASSIDFFAAQITRGFGASGTASVDWYIDSAYTPEGGVAIEQPQIPPPGPGHELYGLDSGWAEVHVESMAVATGVMGSGIDYVFSPLN